MNRQFPSTTIWVDCGCFVVVDYRRKFLPQVDVKAHTTILSSTSRTTLTQTFVNPDSEKGLDRVSYTFPLYDGVSVVSFTCTIGSRVIKGLVKEREGARKEYQAAVDRGETAGLLEQSHQASDVFTTTLGNVPKGATVKVEITYLGELKHDAEVDGLRFTIPTCIAPRYSSDAILKPLDAHWTSVGRTAGKISITVDAHMAGASSIKAIQSPSHPIAVSIGTTSIAPDAEPSLQKASATLALDTAHMDRDFVLNVVATNLGNPSAVLETHPELPDQRALMTTLVPKFNLPPEKPEIIFVCDRSGSMSNRIDRLVTALQLFLKSLPLGVKFNICSFGTRFDFLWRKSQTYGSDTLEQAVEHVRGFSANYGGTEMIKPMEATFKRRYRDMNLEVFLLTDGEIWEQNQLFELVNKEVVDSKGAVRVFTLGVGRDVSHALIEGVARAGNGFSQSVGDDEKMDKKIIRMLKASLTPHINDYTLEIKYRSSSSSSNDDGNTDSDDGFELVERIQDALTLSSSDGEGAQADQVAAPQQPISLFNPQASDEDGDSAMPDADSTDKKYNHLPAIEVPRYLQTPTDIPPLFPFSRTTVYVLLSESTPNRVPESVVLRATSAHGPLELEIPVTVAADPATTIHQLAARSAVKELEEGRGWLAKARNGSGKLLKEAHEGRFSDMVEREAVRVGLRYQVAGKWTSFVAVEDGGETGETMDVNRVEQESPGGVRSHQAMPQGLFGARPQAMFRSQPNASFGAQPQALFGSQSNASFGAQPQASFGAMSFGAATPPSAPPAPGLFGASTNTSILPEFRAARDAGNNLFGYEAATSPSAGPPLPMAPSPLPAFSQGPQLHYLRAQSRGEQQFQPMGQLGQSIMQAQQQAQQRAQQLPAQQQQQMQQATSLSSYRAAPAPASHRSSASTRHRRKACKRGGNQQTPSKGSPEAALESLVDLQVFSGYWEWADELFDVIEVSKDEVDKATPPGNLTAGREQERRVLATACVLVYLRTRLAEEKEAWEMLAEKAREWIEAETGVSADEVEKAVEGVILAAQSEKAE